MRIHIDTTEPGLVFHALEHRARQEGIALVRSMLHKRSGLGGSALERHPFYGRGADFIIADNGDIALAAIERKTLDDLAKSVVLRDDRAPEGRKLFRQLRDLKAHPMPVLVVEGSPSPFYVRCEPALLGLQVWCAREGIAIAYTTGALSTAHLVIVLARRLAAEMGLPLRSADGTTSKTAAEGGSTLQ